MQHEDVLFGEGRKLTYASVFLVLLYPVESKESLEERNGRDVVAAEFKSEQNLLFKCQEVLFLKFDAMLVVKHENHAFEGGGYRLL